MVLVPEVFCLEVVNFKFIEEWSSQVISTGLIELLPEDFPAYKIGKFNWVPKSSPRENKLKFF